MSDRLLLTVSYESSNSQFTLVLQNRSHSTLRVAVEPQQFHGRIIVTPAVGSPVEWVDSRFLTQLVTGIWGVPTHTLPPQGTITWTLPSFILSDIHGTTLDPQILSGATIHARLDEVAIVPSNAPWGSDNAKQVSMAVTIPRQPR
jgi:hypothetical protein